MSYRAPLFLLWHPLTLFCSVLYRNNNCSGYGAGNEGKKGVTYSIPSTPPATMQDQASSLCRH